MRCCARSSSANGSPRCSSSPESRRTNSGTAFYGSQTLKSFSETGVQELSALSDHLALALYNGRKMHLEESRKQLEAQVASSVQELSRTNAHSSRSRELRPFMSWRSPRGLHESG